jgi:hypothetical protein
MISNEKRKELENIIRGESLEGLKDYLTTARNLLSRSFSTSTKVERDFNRQSVIKEEQKRVLIEYISRESLWFKFTNEEFLSEGGESKVYFSSNNGKVVKVNDGIYYNNWLDFLNSILIHNILFFDTAYKLLGFQYIDRELFIVLEQTFIEADTLTNLEDLKLFLEENGFVNIRRNDYYSKELSLILEDMHDENVLTNNGTFFFIDTVFYIHK